MRKKKSSPGKKPKVHDELSGFEISVDQFGEITSNLRIDELNKFLDENVKDKKLTAKPVKAKQAKKKR